MSSSSLFEDPVIVRLIITAAIVAGVAVRCGTSRPVHAYELSQEPLPRGICDGIRHRSSSPTEFARLAATDHKRAIVLPWMPATLTLASAAMPRYLKYKETVLTPIRDQGVCASCWACVVADTLADRVSVYTRGAVRRSFSAQELMSCWNDHEGCEVGGAPEMAYEYVISRGLSEEADYPYVQAGSIVIPPCSRRNANKGERWFGRSGTDRSLCKDLYAYTEGGAEYARILKENVLNMKRELLAHGPICGTIMVHEDLYSYDGKSVYRVSPGSPAVGGHCIEIVGYSEEGVNRGEPGFRGAYWVVKQSWGNSWQGLAEDYGYFYVRMGTNEAGIESRASRLLPVMPFGVAASSENLAASRYVSYSDYVNDPERANYVRIVTRTRP
jgi:hypothetical protein